MEHCPENVLNSIQFCRKKDMEDNGYQIGCRDVASKCKCLYCKQKKCFVSLSHWYC